MKAYSQSPSSDLLALNPQRSAIRCFKWHLCTYDCDFLPVWHPFLLEVLVFETFLWSSKMRMKEKSFQRCDGKENERATVFFPLLTLRKMQKEANLCWILSYSTVIPPPPKRGRASAVVAERMNHHIWCRWVRMGVGGGQKTPSGCSLNEVNPS